MDSAVMRVVNLLAGAHPSGAVFNPWADVDQRHGCGEGGPGIRRRQLKHYFAARRGSAVLLLVGEAMGYQGGHFSGVPMTSERILLGHLSSLGVAPTDVLPDLIPERTSSPDLKAKGFTEPTATIVWGALRELALDPLQVVLWNTFAWHPYRRDKGLLSNRRPTGDELRFGLPALKSVLGLFPEARLGAVGRVASAVLQGAGFDVVEMRHPAHGGAPAFRRQLAEMAAK
jgi:hypothetical protein